MTIGREPGLIHTNGMDGLLWWFTLGSVVLAITSYLPDPFAFNHAPKWYVVDHGHHTRRTRYWHHFFKLRSVASHMATLAFALVVVTLLVWTHYSESTYSDRYERYVLYACLASAFMAVIFLHYASGLVVSVALCWLIAVKYHITANVVWHWILSGMAAIAIAIGVLYLLSQFAVTKIVAYFQYPLSVAFTVAFGIVVLQHGSVHNYIDSGIRDQNLWPTVVAVGILFALYCFLQWGYATNGLCGGERLARHFDLPDGHERAPPAAVVPDQATEMTPLAVPRGGAVSDSSSATSRPVTQPLPSNGVTALWSKT